MGGSGWHVWVRVPSLECNCGGNRGGAIVGGGGIGRDHVETL